ncbi:uncharacterized protein LOC120328871 [Styela clava]
MDIPNPPDLFDVTQSYVTDDDVTTRSFGNNTLSNTGNDTCEQNNNLFTIAFIPFKIIVTFLNLTLFAAAARDRKKLQRQNYTFSCVMSTLLSNTVYLLMSIWLTVDNYPQVSRSPQEGIMSIEKVIWIFSEAMTASMVLGICANVTSLIYVTLDSVCYVGRSGTERGTKNVNSKKAMDLKVRIAQLLIAASWVLPFLITILSYVWNCAKDCRCPSNNFIGEHCPVGQHCSKMWAPLKTEFLMVVVAVWMIEVLGLIIFVVNGIRRHNKSFASHETSSAQAVVVNMEEGICDIIDDVKGASSQASVQTTKTGTNTENQRKPSVKHKFNWRLKFSIILTGVLVACTSPAAFSIIIDVAVVDPPSSVLLLTSGICMFVYSAICPVLMWKFLPSLRSSTIKLFISVKGSCAAPCGRKTTKSRENNAG